VKIEPGEAANEESLCFIPIQLEEDAVHPNLYLLETGGEG